MLLKNHDIFTIPVGFTFIAAMSPGLETQRPEIQTETRL